MHTARLEGQLTFDDLVRTEPVTVEGSHAITQLRDLRPGDFIRCHRRNGVIFEGWCVAYNAFNDFWEVEWQWLEHKPGDREFAAPWDDPQDTMRFRILDVDDLETATYIRHDAQWRFHPTRTRSALVCPSARAKRISASGPDVRARACPRCTRVPHAGHAAAYSRSSSSTRSGNTVMAKAA